MSPADLASLGWNDRWEALWNDEAPENSAPGRVIRHDGVAALVTLEAGTGHIALSGTTGAVTVGDWVAVAGAGDGGIGDTARISGVLTRSSLLERRDPSGGDAQLLAANVDRVVMVCGADRPLRHGRIQRGAALAWEAGAVPAVVVTKDDLADDIATLLEEARTADPALDVLATSALTHDGIDDLAELVGAGTVVFIGESGAGKSCLVNALAGEQVAATGGVRSGDSKGRHTTTTRQLHALPSGGCVIDSPGIREMGIWASTDSVDAAFSEIGALAADCRFNDCVHDTEPGCAVVAAVADGTLDAGRLASWRSLRKEAAAAELRNDPRARKQAGKRFGEMAREAQEFREGR